MRYQVASRLKERGNRGMVGREGGEEAGKGLVIAHGWMQRAVRDRENGEVYYQRADGGCVSRVLHSLATVFFRLLPVRFFLSARAKARCACVCACVCACAHAHAHVCVCVYVCVHVCVWFCHAAVRARSTNKHTGS